MSEQEPMHKAKEVAKRFRIHVSTVLGCVKRGDIRGIRIGRSVRIPESELKRLIQGMELPQTAA